MRNIEFYNFNKKVFYIQDEQHHELTQSSHEMIEFLNEAIDDFYPEASEALSQEYVSSAKNTPYFFYLRAIRFAKCNFGNNDHLSYDIDYQGTFHLEDVQCPLRGICTLEGVVCHPQFSSRITKAELQVIKLLCDGYTEQQCADQLHRSPHTVRTQIRNACVRLNINSKHELTSYAQKHNLI